MAERTMQTAVDSDPGPGGPSHNITEASHAVIVQPAIRH
jgi:hypothetical protein